MLSKREIEEIVEFDRAARFREQYDRRRYGTSSKRELSFASRHVIAADPYGGMGGDAQDERNMGVGVWAKPQMTLEQALGFAAHFGGPKTALKLRSYWDPRDGERVKDGAPTRKTLRYNYIVPDKPYRGKDAAARNRKEREVTVVHVAVRLNRAFVPVVKDVMRFSMKRDVIEMRDMGYHQLGGWICYWDRKDYENKAIRAYIEPAGLGEWSKIDYKWRGAATFPWHETVNVEALKGTRYEWCQYEDGHGIGLCDWLKLYRGEPKVELLAKLKLYSVISPMGVREMKKPKIFNYVKENLAQLQKGRYSIREIVWSANRGTTLAKGVHHYKLVNSFKYFKPDGLRLDYERADKLIRKLKVDVNEYCRYLRYAKKAGLDLRNEGTVYPPVAGGRKAFMARLERIEAEAAKREAERDMMEKYGVKSPEEVKKIMEARVEEIAAFQTSIDRLKTLKGAGYKLILAKTQEDLIAEGKRMGNCVGCGTYGTGIVRGDTLILVIQGKDRELRFDVEISRKTWKVRQCYAPHNKAAPEGIKKLAAKIAQALKAEYVRNRKKKRFAKLYKKVA